MFSYSSSFQINGGNFYDVAGDMDIRSMQPLGHDDSVLGVGPAQDNIARGRRLVGGRGRRQGVRALPYDVSHRPHMLSNSNTSYLTDARNPISLDRTRHESGDTHSRPDLHPDLKNSNAIEYCSDAERRSSGFEYNDPSLSAVLSSVPNPRSLSQQNRPGGPLRWPGPTKVHPVSSNVGQGPSTVGQPHLPAEPASGSLAIFKNSSFPCDRLLHEPKTTINGGTFISGNVNNIHCYGETGLRMLYSAIASDAFHDSAERHPQPQCHPDTRTKMLDVLRNWACGTEPPRRWMSADYEDYDESGESCSKILWLHGPAGSGKSAIAQSLCQQLQRESRLGGSFFFKRGPGCRANASKLFITIAYQLALLRSELNHAITQTVENDPAIVNRSFSDQLKQLIIEPCRRTSLAHPVCVVIDGLDECEGQHIQQEILRAVAIAMRQQPLPILFFIASRPEAHISEVFNEPFLDGFHRAVNIRQSFEDYIAHNTMATVSRPWPPPEVIEELVDKSSGYFIYASTIIKYINDKNFRPTDRLEIIMGIKERGVTSPFDMLDQLYIQILFGVPLDYRPQLLKILTATVVYRLRLCPRDVEQLLELHPGDIHLVLRSLHSVIKVEKDSFITIHHTSFLDFLNDPARSGPFYIGGSQHRVDLLRCTLKALTYKGDDSSLTHIGHSSW
ncbi:hypothetical protein B0H11DRAFT_2399948 [Mycena galericulata]|nr:hypothetical protein B0H11DRAFT_2399948 [Mycena galericulata]